MVFNISTEILEEILLSGAHFGSRPVPRLVGELIVNQDTEKHFYVEFPENAQFAEVYTQDGWKSECERRVLFSERRKVREQETVKAKTNRPSKQELQNALIKAAMEGNQEEVERISKLM